MSLIKMITTAGRAGASIERVGRLLEAGVSATTVAQQLTDNNRNGEIVTIEDVNAYNKMYIQAKSAVAITKKQTEALLADQKISDILSQPA